MYSKIIARDLRLVASRLHRMAVTRPWVTCRRYKKSKHSYRYDLVKIGGNSVKIETRKSIAARFHPFKTGHTLLAKYLRQIGKRRDVTCL